MKKVGIIIVNYKGYAQEFLADCVKSLRTQECPNFFWQLYLIDNSSSKDSREYLKKYAVEAKILARPDGNYCAANNVGIKAAQKDNCDYFVIANMDVIFEKNWLQELVKVAQDNNEAGLVQSKILLATHNNQKIINSVGNSLNFLGFGFTRGYKETDQGQYDSLREIFGYASGSALLITKEVILRIGFYDERYYMYHDDVELGWRARLAGFKIMLAPHSVIYHKYEFSRSVRMLYYMERNRYLAFFSFYKFSTIVLLLPPLLAMECGMIFYSIINGWFLTKIRVCLYFLKPKTWYHILQVRKRVKQYRRLSDRNMAENIVGKVENQDVMNPVLKYLANPLFNLYWLFIRKIIFW